MPRIESIDPVQAPAGEAYPLTLHIVGGPFDEEGNRVHFGDLVIDDVPSADGTTLVVRVPKSVRRAAEVPPEVLRAGTYDVIVETEAGRSEPVTFTLTGPEVPRRPDGPERP